MRKNRSLIPNLSFLVITRYSPLIVHRSSLIAHRCVGGEEFGGLGVPGVEGGGVSEVGAEGGQAGGGVEDGADGGGVSVRAVEGGDGAEVVADDDLTEEGQVAGEDGDAGVDEVEQLVGGAVVVI